MTNRVRMKKYKCPKCGVGYLSIVFAQQCEMHCIRENTIVKTYAKAYKPSFSSTPFNA